MYGLYRTLYVLLLLPCVYFVKVCRWYKLQTAYKLEQFFVSYRPCVVNITHNTKRVLLFLCVLSVVGKFTTKQIPATLYFLYEKNSARWKESSRCTAEHVSKRVGIIVGGKFHRIRGYIQQNPAN